MSNVLRTDMKPCFILKSCAETILYLLKHALNPNSIVFLKSKLGSERYHTIGPMNTGDG